MTPDKRLLGKDAVDGSHFVASHKHCNLKAGMLEMNMNMNGKAAAINVQADAW